ncbi:MAG: phage tail tape measure protein, partial [Rikenellaceae bacterium]
MAQEQNYSVNYTINVEATKGTQQVQAFADAVGKLVQAKNSFTPAITNIKKMMDEIDKTFRTKSGKKRDYTFTMSINTDKSEEKLNRIKGLLSEINTLAKGINVSVNAGQALDTNRIKANAKDQRNRRLADERNTGIKESAAESVNSMMSAQKSITKVIGKINSAMTHLEKGREINIKTETAEERIKRLLYLMGQLKGASTFSVNANTPQGYIGKSGATGAPFAPNHAFVLPQKVADQLNTSLVKNRVLGDQKAQQQRTLLSDKLSNYRETVGVRGEEWNRQRVVRNYDIEQNRIANERVQLDREKRSVERQNTAGIVRQIQGQSKSKATYQTSKQKAAINRLQYMRGPSMSNLPMMQMFNAYAAYSLLTSELTKAVEYTNIMTSAQSILRVADSDLTTFEGRFSKMALYVRQIGVETKFTAMEVAGAVKYLSMAGMGVETINESIRPITNLALIGDNDVSQIADLATNIMAGYDIKSSSMGSVADILASTISRSNVNVIEMAESYKMAAGYMRMAGIDFTESSAAIGILGNMGIKGTMAGTSLRAMATRFAKPTKESQESLDRLGVKFTHYVDVYGKQVERLRPLTEIFQELNEKGATMGDMQSIFGKIGGNAAMMFVRNYDQLRTLTSQNRGSHNVSSVLAKVKQDNTKGLWAQMTSQFTESFMQGYEHIEPIIKSTMRDFIGKFKTREFALGIASIGQTLLNLVTILAKFGAWFSRNMTWIEPLLFSGIAATKLFKLAGALTNIGVALGFVGKQSAAGKGLSAISSLVGLGGGKMSFASKRSIVTALQGAGVAGKGAMSQALLSGGMGMAAQGGGLFATQVATGNGLIGAGASLSAIGTGAVAATGGIAALIGALGWVAYKTWKVKEAKDAVLEEISANEKYRYPSIDALNTSLSETYQKALDARKEVEKLTGEKTIEDASGHKIGAWTSNWWAAVFNSMSAGQSYGMVQPTYTLADAQQDDTRAAITTLARRDSQARINSAFAALGKARSDIEIGAFIENIQSKFGQDHKSLDKTLFTVGKDGKATYVKSIKDMAESDVYKLYDYGLHMNTKVVPEIRRFSSQYRDILSSASGAENYLANAGFDFESLALKGFTKNDKGEWFQTPLGKDATDG